MFSDLLLWSTGLIGGFLFLAAEALTNRAMNRATPLVPPEQLKNKHVAWAALLAALGPLGLFIGVTIFATACLICALWRLETTHIKRWWNKPLDNPTDNTVKDGSLLDDEGLAALQQMVAAEGYQLWLERVGSDGAIGIIIEDGSVKE